MYMKTKEQFAKNARQYGNANVRRIKLEQSIARRVVRGALAEGWKIAVFDSETRYPASESFAEIWSQMGESDEDILYVFKPGEDHAAFIHLIWGNGEDIVSDYSVSIEDFIKKTLPDIFDF